MGQFENPCLQQASRRRRDRDLRISVKRGFRIPLKSKRDPENFIKLSFIRSAHSLSFEIFGQVAQSVEQRPEKPCVASSILALSTSKMTRVSDPPKAEKLTRLSFSESAGVPKGRRQISLWFTPLADKILEKLGESGPVPACVQNTSAGRRRNTPTLWKVQ